MSNKEWQNKRVTIKDIARAAGVDPSTVTRALQGSERVRQSTRDLIQNLAIELGYVPSAMARSLVTQRSQLLGVVIPDMTNPFFSALMKGIEHQAAEHKLRTLIRSTDGDENAERDAIGLFSELNVDGLIVPMARCPQSFYQKLDSSTPVIHVNRDDAPHHVSCDTVTGSYQLMQHLTQIGHRHIAFVNGPAGPAREPKRFAYESALRDAGIALDENLTYQYDGSTQKVREIADQLLQSNPRPTAVFAWNDVCAIALIHVMHERGVRIPEELSIAGHDDIEMAGLVHPALTTVHWPMYELGVQSVYQIMRMRGEVKDDTPAVPAPKLIVRASTGPIEH